MKCCMYLRKSRQDIELERKEDIDTLARHRSTLLQLAKRKNLDIIDVKEELQSGGDSIASRPRMIQLLEEVRIGKYDGILVMDIDRLGRGDLQDQGLWIKTFKENNTLVITPDKTYNLNNENDETMTEFKAFFARFELKQITKRMQRGRVKSVEEGNFIASYAPYGYKFEYSREGKRLLVLDEEKAPIVRNIFDMYINGNGVYKIKTFLNNSGFRTSNNNLFSENAVRRILKNKTYAGYVTWNKYRRKGTKTTKAKEEDLVVSKGIHPPIISEELFDKVQRMINSRNTAPVSSNKVLTNPLAGLVKCACCGHTMTNKSASYKGEGYVKFICCKECDENRGVKNSVLEDTIIVYLEDTLQEFEEKITSNKVDDEVNTRLQNLEHTLSLLEKETEMLRLQKNKLHDLLERGVYDVDTYLERTQELSKKTDENKTVIENTKLLIENEKSISINYDELSFSIKNVLENYRNTNDILLKNHLLKSVIEEVIYFKEKGKRNAKFEIDIKLKI